MIANTTFENLIHQIDDNLNAILVKELRQAVRGKFFWSVYLIYLVIICLILFFSLNEAGRNNMFNGDIVSTFLLISLYFIAGLLVPIKIGKKTSSEIGDATNELLYTTTMSASSIVWGKFFCGAVIILMLYSALVPFLSLTLFMGGVDLRLLFLLLIYSYMLSNLGIIWQIFMAMSAGIKASETNNLMNAAGGSIAHLVVWIISITFANGIISEYSYGSKSSNFWVGTVIFLLVYFFVAEMLFISCVSKLEPEASNRKFGLRYVCSIAWMIGTIVTAFIDYEAIMVWTVVFSILLMFLSVDACSEPDSYSSRVIDEIPDSTYSRISKFPFFTGMANGLCWVAIMTVLTMFVAFLGTIVHFKTSSDFSYLIISLTNFLLHATAYGLIVSFIRKAFIDKNYKTGVTQVAVTSFFLVNIISGIGFNIFFRYGSDLMEKLIVLINPFMALGLGRREIGFALIGGGFWFILGVVVNLKTLIWQFKTYFNKGYY